MHSSRKATQSALIGIYASKGVIDINKSIGEYGIDEATPLTDVEKNATVKQLMTGYSGIYLPSVAQGGGDMPKRGSHQPGEHWYYNNWTFNALNTLFEQQTHVKLTDAFVEHIAQPIGMEDFVPHDAWYNYEKFSLHPVYHINMSSRDMARFGMLYMNGGRWGDKQIVPEQWVKESLTAYTQNRMGKFRQLLPNYWVLIDTHYPNPASYQLQVAVPSLFQLENILPVAESPGKFCGQ
jgi:CubicO group peptidase (beta-lactamase class C family)